MTTPSLNPAEPVSGIQLVQLPPERRITMFALACLVFFTTCGGAFGLEALIGAVGPGWAVVFILVTPFVWSLPTALMVAELATLMPEEGGYYVWVREALGPAWGVQQACCTMTTAVVWLAMYPVLFVSYLAFFFPNPGDLGRPAPWMERAAALGDHGAGDRIGDGAESARRSRGRKFREAQHLFCPGRFRPVLADLDSADAISRFVCEHHPQRSCVRSQGSFAAGAFGRHLQLLRMGQCFHLCWRGGRTTTQLPTGHGHRAAGPGSLVPAAGARGDHDHDKSRSLEFGCRLASHLAVDGRKMAWLTGGCSGIGVDVGII